LEREVLFWGSLRGLKYEDFDTLITAVTFELTGQLALTIVLGEYFVAESVSGVCQSKVRAT
jgi:hypothetical protein